MTGYGRGDRVRTRDGRAVAYLCDFRDALGVLTREGVLADAVVTDPPYHLQGTQPRFARSPRSGVTERKAVGPSRRTGRGFMGKSWDGGDVAFDPETWRAVGAAMKPGAHLLAFGSTRTHHRIWCAVEDAGFEVRDTVMWLHGQGFPKSRDVSKDIDRMGGGSAMEQARTLRGRREATGLTRAQVAEAVGCTESSVRDWEEGRARSRGGPLEWIVPSQGYREALADLLGYSKDERVVAGLSVDRRDDGTVIGLGHSGILREGGRTSESARWAGWGTALKPSWEPVLLARKPLEAGTVAENVLRYGTGALNAGACLVGSSKCVPASPSRTRGVALSGSVDGSLRRETGDEGGHNPNKGRWPANVAHDGSPEVLSLFPESTSRGHAPRLGKGNPFGGRNDRPRTEYHLDRGSAARFFYCAKATRAERNLGLASGIENEHPTVKPVALMRWLVRLVTPPGGLVLDPFAGSGSTGVAALREGMRFACAEADPEYWAVLAARLAHAAEAGAPTGAPPPRHRRRAGP